MLQVGILSDIYSIFYPDLCLSCKNHLVTNELSICVNCRHDLPLTHFSSERNNVIEQIFYGRVPIENATSLLYFSKKSKVQALIHALKYKGHQEIGTLLGAWLGGEIAATDRFKNIDYIIPVPLHKNRYRKRGFNQVTTFGQSLAKKLNIPYNDKLLTKITSTNSQTRKVRFERWRSVSESFNVERSDKLKDLHLLLVDDIITTGSTLEACCKAFENSKNIKFSIATMACAK